MNPDLLRSAQVALLAPITLLLMSVPATGQGSPDPVLETTTWRGQEIVKGEVLVAFTAGTPGQVQEQHHSAVGAGRLGTVTPLLALVRAPAGVDLDVVLERYTTFSDVRWAWPNTLHRPVGRVTESVPGSGAPAGPPAGAPGLPNDFYWSVQWGPQKVRAPEAWDSGDGSPASVVAIIDSGVDTDHPDLDEHLAWGLDTYASDGDPSDSDGHGTHCAGIAAAETNNAIGVAGAARNCSFAAYRCGNASFPTSALVAAIHDAREQGCKVISMSWGSQYGHPAIEDALQEAHDAGCVLVAAAGNDGVSTPFYPAALPFVISVGSSTQGDGRSGFSNWGGWVDIAAPGQSIYSTYKNGGYAYLSGTSMACPLVAGAALHLYDRLGGGRSPEAAAQVTAALMESAVPIGTWVVHGRMDFAAAHDTLMAAPAPTLGMLHPELVPAFGGSEVTLTGSGLDHTLEITVDGDAADFEVLTDSTLVFTPATASSLGPVGVVLTTAGGTVASQLTFIETNPPALDVPSATASGLGFTWAFGGAAYAGYHLLVAIDATTMPIQGVPILADFLVLTTNHLDHAGLGEISVTIPAGFGGLTFHSQVVTFGAGGLGASGVHATQIAP